MSSSSSSAIQRRTAVPDNNCSQTGTICKRFEQHREHEDAAKARRLNDERKRKMAKVQRLASQTLPQAEPTGKQDPSETGVDRKGKAKALGPGHEVEQGELDNNFRLIAPAESQREVQEPQRHDGGELVEEGIDAGPSKNSTISELYNQLQEEQNRCKELQQKVEEKTNRIRELEAARASTLNSVVNADEHVASKWKENFERAAAALKRTEEERAELRKQLEEAEDKIGKLTLELRKAQRELEDKNDEIAYLRRKHERQLSESNDDNAHLQKQLAATAQSSFSSPTSPTLSLYNGSRTLNQEIQGVTTPATSFTLPTAPIVEDDRSGPMLASEDSVDPRASLTQSVNETAEEVSACSQSDAPSTQTSSPKSRKEKQSSSTNQAVNFFSGKKRLSVGKGGRLVLAERRVVLRV